MVALVVAASAVALEAAAAALEAAVLEVVAAASEAAALEAVEVGLSNPLNLNSLLSFLNRLFFIL